MTGPRKTISLLNWIPMAKAKKTQMMIEAKRVKTVNLAFRMMMKLQAQPISPKEQVGKKKSGENGIARQLRSSTVILGLT